MKRNRASDPNHATASVNGIKYSIYFHTLWSGNLIANTWDKEKHQLYTICKKLAKQYPDQTTFDVTMQDKKWYKITAFKGELKDNITEIN